MSCLGKSTTLFWILLLSSMRKLADFQELERANAKSMQFISAIIEDEIPVAQLTAIIIAYTLPYSLELTDVPCKTWDFSVNVVSSIPELVSSRSLDKRDRFRTVFHKTDWTGWHYNIIDGHKHGPASYAMDDSLGMCRARYYSQVYIVNDVFFGLRVDPRDPQYFALEVGTNKSSYFLDLPRGMILNDINWTVSENHFVYSGEDGYIYSWNLKQFFEAQKLGKHPALFEDLPEIVIYNEMYRNLSLIAWYNTIWIGGSTQPNFSKLVT